MNQTNKLSGEDAEMAAGVVKEMHPVASPSRRRIIRLGASAVPVLATLTSQSALAGQCISTSAWGSDQISGSASQAARHAGQGVAVTTGWTITAWNSSSDGSGTAWEAFKSKYGINSNPNSFTFADLYGYVGGTYMRDPSSFGFVSTAKVAGGLGNNDDQSYFLVAMLNYAVGAEPPTECVTDANWLAIVAGTYPAGTPWTVNQIRLYLQNNYIVQA